MVHTMPSVFLLEDSQPTAAAITEAVEKRLELDVVQATALQEARSILGGYKVDYVAAVVDLFLPDATASEALELVLRHEIPTIVFTSSMDAELRETIWNLGIVDYVLKDRERSLDYLVSMLGRLKRNPNIKILIVDDSKVMRDHYAGLLEKHRYVVLRAESGEQALELLQTNSEVKLALIDYIMPDMDGLELTAAIRHSYAKEELSIIALSGQDKEEISAQFIKSGANDYIDKRMSLEGFYCRISHQVDMLEHIAQLREFGYLDYLTKLYNRRYFFDAGRSMLAAVKRRNGNAALAMLDIDHFKKINDTFGHDVGDEVIKELARLLKSRFRESDLITRFGGEEFCILLQDLTPDEAGKVFEQLRGAIENTPVKSPYGEVRYTASIGVVGNCCVSLEEMISSADKLLYKAKNKGRNRVELGM